MIYKNQESWILAVWFVGVVGMDWMACVFRQPGEEGWRLHYRFRYHSPESTDVFDGDRDRKSWYEADLPSLTEAQAIASVAVLAQVTAKQCSADVNDFIEVRGGVADLIAKLRTKSWAHIQEQPPMGKGTGMQ